MPHNVTLSSKRERRGLRDVSHLLLGNWLGSSLPVGGGIWGIGVATQKANLNQIPLGRDVHSLVMRNDGALYYNNEEKNRLPANNLPQEGDVVGITYDHVELNVYLNGKNMHCPASGIRGTVYPVVYVDDSAILDCQFSEFYHTPPPGFEKILFEQQIF
ncbi:PREDICTED: SPRY domain-containing protein 7 isoform X3 [Haliaeetus leucocephalus]|uniref:SPRY domain-containing protein 7 isoform X3 n=1 Tax=Haliaeetus leucocephalus TaxID=52644 RepID=UPI00053CB2B8|nr:PREDICTED: SPRY domain-containing protein 7 isoform X3 [Haliaeetus leucocephalus]